MLVALGMALVLVVAARDADLSGSVRSVDWVALVESTIQTLVFGGLTLLFLNALAFVLAEMKVMSWLVVEVELNEPRGFIRATYTHEPGPRN